MSRLVKFVVLVFVLTGCTGPVVYHGVASSPEPLVIPSSTLPATSDESTEQPPATIGVPPAAPGVEDWAAVTISELNALRNGPVSSETLSTLTATCLDSVNAFTMMGQILLGDAHRVLDIGVAAENGTESIAEASSAFDIWGNTAMVVGYMAIHVVDNSSFPPDAVAFIDDLGEAAGIAGSSAFAISYQAFVAAGDEIHETELEVWRGGLSEGLDGLASITDSVNGEDLCR